MNDLPFNGVILTYFHTPLCIWGVWTLAFTGEQLAAVCMN